MRLTSPHRPSFVLTCALGGVYVAAAVLLRPSPHAEDAAPAPVAAAHLALASQPELRDIDRICGWPGKATPDLPPRAASTLWPRCPTSRAMGIRAAQSISKATPAS